MANPHKGDVEIDVAGKPYMLRYSIDALCELEAKVGLPWRQIALAMSAPETVTVILTRAMLWAALRQHHNELTLGEAGELIVPLGGVDKVVPHLSRALELAFPAAPEGEKSNPPAMPS